MLDMIKGIILLQNQLSVVNSKLSLLYRMPCMSACQRGLRTNVLACQRAKSVPTCQTFLEVLRKISLLYYYIKNSTFYLIS